MNHIWVQHTNCNNPTCWSCAGGLSICSVCGLYEGSLTTDCPGYQCYGEKSDAVYKGEIDFVAGQWVPKVSIHSPERYR